MAALPATFAAVTRAWLALLVAFEAAAVVRLLVLGQPLSVVMPVFAAAGKGGAPANAPQQRTLTNLVALLAVLLAAVRGAQLAAGMDAAPQWTLTAVVHVVEAAYFCGEFFVNQRAGAAKYPTAAATLVFSIVMLNAAWFALARVLLG